MYQHLNLDNAWPLVQKFGLEVDSDTGSLTLRKLPGPPKAIGCIPGEPSTSPGKAGVVAGSNGAIFVSDPKGHQVFRVDPLSGQAAPLSCVSHAEAGWDVGQLHQPQGLAFQSCRNRLLIADTKNRRIQVVDPERARVVAVWGQTWPYEMPLPCGGCGGLDGPEHISCDRAGNVYVVDRNESEKSRVVKLTPDGELAATLFPCEHADPVHIAVGLWKPEGCDALPQEYVFVLAVSNPSPARRGELELFVYDTDGKQVVSYPLRLLTSDATSTTAAVSVVKYEFNASSANSKSFDPVVVARELRDLVNAFTVIGTNAIVALASTPPRVWCFEIAEAIAADNRDAVEPSWLPLYDGVAAALGVRGNPLSAGSRADVLLFAGRGSHLFALPHRGAFRAQGAFLAGPFAGNRDQVTAWHRLRFDGRMSENGRTQIFTLSRSAQQFGRTAPVRMRDERIPNWFRVETQPDMFEQLGFASTQETEPEREPDEFSPELKYSSLQPPSPPDRTPPGEWFAIPQNQFDGLVQNSGGTPNNPADQLWVFGLIAGDGQTSPELFQARLEHDEDGWLSDLPDYYQRDATSRAFMRSLLALFESRFEDITESIDRLPTLFSPHAMSYRYGRNSQELDWLRRVLALPTNLGLKDKPRDHNRNVQIFADGPYWLGRRGTPEGIRRLVWLATGVEIIVDEPGLDQIPNVVGVLDPAIVDQSIAATADCFVSGLTLGYSTLPDPDDPQPRLPNDLAHHFVVRGYESDFSDSESRELVEQVVARLAPAHTTYSVQMIEPQARVGMQARLGIDSVVARNHPSSPWAVGEPPGSDFQIDPSPQQPTVGAAHLGSHNILM